MTYFDKRDELIALTGSEKLVDDLLDAHAEYLGQGEVPQGTYETVCGLVIPDDIVIRATGPTFARGSGFLAIHGDWPPVMSFIASMLHHMDWVLETNYKPADRLAVQRRIDARLEGETW